MIHERPALLALVGTTASGKSALAVDLALRLGGEIVSADSRQVYRGLDIGTGKITPHEQRGVPHHLLDVADVRARFTAADYQRLALAAIQDIQQRQRVPILVGGTGLYIQAVIDNPLYPPSAPSALRQMVEELPLEEALARLDGLDPAGAQQIDRHNPRRVARALEVSLVTGQPFSRARRFGEPAVCALQLGLTWPREVLRQRILDRLQARMAGHPSLVDEVRGLLDGGVPLERLLELGLEYRYVGRFLQGELSEPELTRDLAGAINRFAKRQMTWFRRDKRICWLDLSQDPLAQAETLARAFLSGAPPAEAPSLAP